MRRIINKRGLLLIVSLILSVNIFGKKFSVINEDGITIYYQITSEKRRSVSVVAQESELPQFITYPKGVINIPLSVKHNNITYTVTTIGKSAFANCSGIVAVNLSDSITQIESNAFFACDQLKHIKLPKALEEIGGFAFYGCSSCDSLHLPERVNKIGSYAFGQCSNLKSIIIPSSLKEIGDNAFMNTKWLDNFNAKTIYINGLAYINRYNQSSNKKVYIKEGEISSSDIEE